MKHQRISEFSSSLNVSHTAIRKAINRGRIPSNLVRTKELPSGRKVTFIINPRAARDAFLATACRDDVLDDHPEGANSAGDIPTSISRRTWDADEVTQMVHEEYFFAREVLMAIPGRVAESFAACADAEEIRAALEGAIRVALDDLTCDIDQFYADDISDIEPETSASN